jgi:hypothetical protein
LVNLGAGAQSGSDLERTKTGSRHTGGGDQCVVFSPTRGPSFDYALTMSSMTGRPTIRYATSLERLI